MKNSQRSKQMSKACLSFVRFIEEKKVNKSSSPKQFVSDLYRLLYLFGKSSEDARTIHAEFPFIMVDMLPEEHIVEAIDFFNDTLSYKE